MRRTRALVALGFALLVLPMLMGATITISAINPNPGAKANILAANGTFTLAANEKLSSASFQAIVKDSNPPDPTSATPTLNMANKTWTWSKFVTATTYNPCNAYLDYYDSNNNFLTAKDKNTTDQTVK